MLQRNNTIILCILAILGYAINRIGGATRKEYYDDGKIKAIYPLNKKGLIDGVAKTYYPNGKIKSEKNMKTTSKSASQKIIMLAEN
jgi:antitoxin component YwqK of YwqJK toxin-antitoxin module